MLDHEKYMAEAIKEAETGLAEGEVPIGAVAVKDGKIIARGHNRRNQLKDITRHAEIECLNDLSKNLPNGFDLSGITLYSTLEPCAMCSGAMIHYGINHVVYGEKDVINGASGSKFDFLQQAGITVEDGVLRDGCRNILLRFFEQQLGKKTFIWEDIELPVT